MSEERKYAYMIKKDGFEIGIMYQLGRYCVASFYHKSDGMMAHIIRQYKTLSGAERFLLKDYSYGNRLGPEIYYATEKFIKEGKYWKEDN